MKTDALLEDSWGGWDEEELATARKANLKYLVFIAFVALVHSGLTALPFRWDPLPEASVWRTIAQCVLAAGMLMEIVLDAFAYPPLTKTDNAWLLVRNAGKPIFLTSWLLTIQFVHESAGAAAEVSLLLGTPLTGLVHVNYAAAILVGTLGTALALLFLKFNYFEEKWRIEIKDLWEKRGFRFGLLSLLGHLPSLPIAFLDIGIKDSTFMHLCTPSLIVQLGVVAGFTIMYNLWMHVWWAASGFKSWPYPFLHDFDTCLKRVVFGLVIFVAISILLFGMNFLP